MDPVIKAILEKIKEIRVLHEENLIDGSLPTFDEYRHACGVIKGMSMVEREIKDLSKTSICKS